MIRTAPQHAPHTRPTVREKTGNSGCYKQILPHSLDQFVGRAKVLVRTSPRPKMLQSTTKQTHGLCLVDKISIITLTYVVQIFPTLKNTHHHASHNPQTNKQDQKGSKRYLADFSKLRTRVHGASRCGFSRSLPPSENIQKPCGYHLKFGVARAHSLRKGTSNAICKLWPPLKTCWPGLAWKSPASTLAHRLAVIHPDIRTRWPERLRTQPVPNTADDQDGTPACAPHPANGARKDRKQWLLQADIVTFSGSVRG